MRSERGGITSVTSLSTAFGMGIVSRSNILASLRLGNPCASVPTTPTHAKLTKQGSAEVRENITVTFPRERTTSITAPIAKSDTTASPEYRQLIAAYIAGWVQSDCRKDAKESSEDYMRVFYPLLQPARARLPEPVFHPKLKGAMQLS